MKWGCRSRQSSFGQALLNKETLATYEFFLLYHGNGYGGEYVGNMTMDTLVSHVNRLHDQLTEEKRVHDENVRKAKAAAKRARR